MRYGEGVLTRHGHQILVHTIADKHENLRLLLYAKTLFARFQRFQSCGPMHTCARGFLASGDASCRRRVSVFVALFRLRVFCGGCLDAPRPAVFVRDCRAFRVCRVVIAITMD